MPESANATRLGTPTGVTAPQGFRAAGVHCGIRKQRPDLALLVSDSPASAAAVYTRNLVQAAPLTVCREHLEATGGVARAVVVNAGNANACTGESGLAAARRTAEEASRLLAIRKEEVLVASTGVIGQALPVDRLIAGLPEAVSALSDDGGHGAAEAILTTDTCTKEAVRRVETPEGSYVLGGVAKGSGMIHPDMATTLAFVTTDAAVPADRLRRSLVGATELSFNRITVDGDTSTNDMIAVLANGASGLAVADAQGAFDAALTDLLVELAKKVARDGEGATRLIAVRVTGAASEAEALRVARTISGSPLVRTAVHGADANWGRIVAAVGRAGVDLDPERLAVAFDELSILEPGWVSDFSEEEATRVLGRDEVTLSVDLGRGPACAITWTCDLTADYVAINASYRS